MNRVEGEYEGLTDAKLSLDLLLHHAGQVVHQSRMLDLIFRVKDLGFTRLTEVSYDSVYCIGGYHPDGLRTV